MESLSLLEVWGHCLSRFKNVVEISQWWWMMVWRWYGAEKVVWVRSLEMLKLVTMWTWLFYGGAFWFFFGNDNSCEKENKKPAASSVIEAVGGLPHNRIVTLPQIMPPLNEGHRFCSLLPVLWAVPCGFLCIKGNTTCCHIVKGPRLVLASVVAKHQIMILTVGWQNTWNFLP